jgi:single-strand DNA-binding protein
MADLNKVMLIGRLTRDPQLRFLPSQAPVCDFGLAVGRKWKTPTGETKEETCFVDCTIFGKGGEIFSQYMAKGKQVYCEGRLRLDQWDDKTTGQKRSKLNVIVEDFQFLGSPGDGQRSGGDEGGGGERQSYGGGSGGSQRSGGYGAGSGGASRPPSRPPAASGRPPAQQSPDPEPPYNDEQQFKEDDIPF